MPAGVIGDVWEAAESTACASLVRRYEADWRAASARSRPDPRRYLSADGEAPPGALLALLRAQLALSWEAGRPITAESYRRDFPELEPDSLVALAYEEYCQREDGGQCPDLEEFLARYPDLAGGLRRVLEIHGLVGSRATVSLGELASPHLAFPEAGQTIGGFRLVSELGRGSFARVFRAEERQLADRSVVLKVARTGSREPQTLARLQHTHIVPVHSYRIDLATGLHLLCMPYLGGVTLAQLLADPQVAAARSGADLLAALDRLDPVGAARPSASREALSGLSYVRAIALWGARLAQALHYANERGVLHRDVKPSNILVTGDGLPMLLDFNLAWESCLGQPNQAPGGTLAYMAPEHLEALAEGHCGRVDSRSDLYSLGVVLYEAMGSSPFGPPERGASILETLQRNAQRRRLGPPPLRDQHPEVSAEFAAVVERCLASDPARRYGDASQLAEDLQAVADDRPLRYAREPAISRAVRWARRNRLRLAFAAPAIAALLVAIAGIELARAARERQTREVRDLVSTGIVLANEGRLDAAEAQFELALKLASRRRDAGAGEPSLQPAGARLWGGMDELQAVARDQSHLAREKRLVRAAAQRLGEKAESLRLRLLRFTDSEEDPSAELQRTLAPFYVLSSPDWTERGELALLEPALRDRLKADVDNLLFLWGIDLYLRLKAEPTEPERARLRDDFLAVVAIGRRTAGSTEPWTALRQRVEDPNRPGCSEQPAPGSERSAATAFQWGVLLGLEGATRPALEWLERAVRLDPSQYWHQFYLAYQYQRTPGGEESAAAHYLAAVALAPERPWPRFNLALLYGKLGAWGRAVAELKTALQAAEGTDSALPILLNLGQAQHALGDMAAARDRYQEVLDRAAADDPLVRAARMNLARLDAETGRAVEALRAYDQLLDARPDDAEARLGRALLRARQGRLEESLEDLDRLDGSETLPVAALTCRAQVNLALGRLVAAEDAAGTALRLRPDPARRRLWRRVLLARGRLGELALDDPADLERLPLAGAALRRDLQAVASHPAGPNDASEERAALDRALAYSRLGDHDAAEREASRAAALSPGQSLPLLVRARIHQTAGRNAAAFADVRRGLEMDPNDGRFLALRGRLRTGAGDADGGLIDLDEAIRLGAGRPAHVARAEALATLGRDREAVGAWTHALRADPEDPAAYLGRARSLARLALWDESLADLEQALAWADDDPETIAQIAATYTLCLPARPDRRARVTALSLRSAATTQPGTMP